MKTPTEVQADMIRELEAKVSLLLDDLFYARAEVAKLRTHAARLGEANDLLVVENDALQKTIATMRERLNWLELDQWYVVDKKETKP